MRKKDKFGHSPLIMSNAQQEEWDELNPELKQFVMANIQSVTSKMTSKLAIETLCFAFNELYARVIKLEKKK